jgi:plasmid stabilization system protein ParE
MRVIYHPEAETELVAAAQFYERRVSTLGAQFLDTVDHAIRAILEAPDRWPIIERDVRCYRVPRFPYGVYYRVLQDHVRILAVKHHSLHPGYWRHRLTD